MFRSDHHAHRPPALRRLCAVVAFWYALVQIVTGVHLATIPHARCAEHDGVVHVISVPGSHTGAGLQQMPSGMPGDEHEHCVVAVSRERPATIATPDTAEIRPAALEVEIADLPPLYAPSPPAERRYLFAPKTSPPA